MILSFQGNPTNAHNMDSGFRLCATSHPGQSAGCPHGLPRGSGWSLCKAISRYLSRYLLGYISKALGLHVIRRFPKNTPACLWLLARITRSRSSIFDLLECNKKQHLRSIFLSSSLIFRRGCHWWQSASFSILTQRNCWEKQKMNQYGKCFKLMLVC